MKATEICRTLPDELQARCSAIVEVVRKGLILPIEWKMIEIRDAKRAVTLQIYVMCDALSMGEPGDWVRINVSHRTQQQIADILGVSMLTAKLADEIHRHADVVITPCTHNPDENAIIEVTDPDSGKPVHVSMSSTTAMRVHSAEVEAKLAAAGAAPGTIRSAVCKHWGNSRLLDKRDANGRRIQYRAMNVGWHLAGAKSISPGGLHLIQPESSFHDWSHADYSQGAVYVHPVVLVLFEASSRVEVGLYEEFIRDPVAAYTMSYDGPLAYTRHPDVDPPATQDVTIAPIPWPWDDVDVEGLTERRRRAWYPSVA